MCYDQSLVLIMGVDIFMGNVFQASIKILEHKFPCNGFVNEKFQFPVVEK